MAYIPTQHRAEGLCIGQVRTRVVHN